MKVHTRDLRISKISSLDTTAISQKQRKPMRETQALRLKRMT